MLILDEILRLVLFVSFQMLKRTMERIHIHYKNWIVVLEELIL